MNWNLTKIDIDYNNVNNNKYHIKIKCEHFISDIKNLKFNVCIHNPSKPISNLDKEEEIEYNLEEDIVKNKKINVDIEIF